MAKKRQNPEDPNSPEVDDSVTADLVEAAQDLFQSPEPPAVVPAVDSTPSAGVKRKKGEVTSPEKKPSHNLVLQKPDKFPGLRR